MKVDRNLMRTLLAIVIPGDPLAYVLLPLVLCILGLVAVSFIGVEDHPVGDNFTVGHGLLGIAFPLAVGLVVLAVIRSFRRPPGVGHDR